MRAADGGGAAGSAKPESGDRAARAFFDGLTRRAKTSLAVSLAVLTGLAFFLKDLRTDPSVEVYLPDDHPAVEMRRQVKEQFGLADPVAFAVIADGPRGVFTPATLAFVASLTRALDGLERVVSVRSLATEKYIFGTDESLEVQRLFEEPPQDEREAAALREAALAFSPYGGQLVARDGTATLVVGEPLHQHDAADVYERMLVIASEVELPPGVQLHVTGEGAASAYMSRYIEADSARTNPLVAGIILLVVYLAYRTVRGLGLALAIVLGSVLAAFGAMAAVGVPVYSITTSMTVILVSIAVCDAIHILGRYYEEVAERPDGTPKEIVRRTMESLWRPVACTSITTMAGFVAISVSSFMPPLYWYGLFASVGVLAALLLSLVALPAALALLRARPSPAYRPSGGPDSEVDAFGRLCARIGQGVARRPGAVLLLALLTIPVCAAGLARLRIDDEIARNFREEEPIVVADRAINQRMDGIYNLYAVFETPVPGDLYEPVLLREIEEFQGWLSTLPGVRGSTSLVDFLKEMNRALNEGRSDAFGVPDGRELVTQSMLLYSPTDLEQYVDSAFQTANVVIPLSTSLFSDVKQTVERIEDHLAREVKLPPGAEAHLAGRSYVNYHWGNELRSDHFRGLAVAFFTIWAVMAIRFRSLVAGAIAVLPVSLSTLLVYAVMGFAGIWLGTATSMFAAIGLGVGVDFAIHTLERLIDLSRADPRLEQNLDLYYCSTGRALLFNFGAIALGFGSLLAGQSPAQVSLGLLIALSVLFSFTISLTVLPAMLLRTRPAFLRAS